MSPFGATSNTTTSEKDHKQQRPTSEYRLSTTSAVTETTPVIEVFFGHPDLAYIAG